MRLGPFFPVFSLMLAGCASLTEPRAELPEVTRVRVSFTPQGGGDTISAYLDDPDGAGPMPVSAQVGNLVFRTGTTYVGSITLEHRLLPTAVDLTDIVEDRASEYRVYHAVAGGLTGAGFIVTPTDVDARNRPLGLSFTAAVHPTVGGESGTLIVTLCEYLTVSKSSTATECVGEAKVTARFAMSAID
ncbi:hypothetical protein Strain138_002454 [Pseudogemmatithrix spongiicola]|uniref:Type 1 periplasmic binding fold superfamily protein n=1 Tax=Pseudogemmatithrix spongiicola TaxID=3062599 RepID=A0AA49K197_9BACT|nr:hypothetical protein Strain138_002454 [Gemmatimonadaceae bacterium 'strain 138']WKW16045.1 hypothetical protein Strain318_002453 [Gemmatimonadaceae bacterium 'strain 318']